MQNKLFMAAMAACFSASALAETPAPPAASAAAPVIVIKFSHVVAMDAPKGQAAERFEARNPCMP